MAFVWSYVYINNLVIFCLAVAVWLQVQHQVVCLSQDCTNCAKETCLYHWLGSYGLC